MAAKKYIYLAKITDIYFDDFKDQVIGRFIIEKDLQEENELCITEDKEVEIVLKDLLKYEINFEFVNFENLLVTLEENLYEIEVSRNFKIINLADGNVYDDIKQYVENSTIDITDEDMNSNFEEGYESYFKLM